MHANDQGGARGALKLHRHRIEQLVAGESGERRSTAGSAQESSSGVLDV
jgi:hypothetical protein